MDNFPSTTSRTSESYFVTNRISFFSFVAYNIEITCLRLCGNYVSLKLTGIPQLAKHEPRYAMQRKKNIIHHLIFVESLLSMSYLPIPGVNSIVFLCEHFRRDQRGCATGTKPGGPGIHFDKSR